MEEQYSRLVAIYNQLDETGSNLQKLKTAIQIELNGVMHAKAILMDVITDLHETIEEKKE